MDKLEAMRTLVAIENAGSLSAAAQSLKKAQPTVVRTLALLEERLGVRLIHRTTRKLSFSVEGRAYVQQCRQVLTMVDEADASIGQGGVELSGPLRVTAPVFFGQLKVAPVIARFLQVHPRVEVDLVLLDRVVNLVEEGFDLGVRIAKLSDSNLIGAKLGELRRVCVASPGLLKRLGTPRHPAALKELPVVTFSHGPVEAWRFEVEGRTRRVHGVTQLRCNQAAAAIAAVEQGLGFGQFLSYQVDASLQRKSLRRILADFEPPAIPVQLLYPSAQLRTARHQALVQWLKAEL